MALPPKPDPQKIRSGRGVCRGCKHSYALDKRGLIRLHWTDGATRKKKCVGAETLPLGQALSDLDDPGAHLVEGVRQAYLKSLGAAPAVVQTSATAYEPLPVHVQGGASMHDLVIEDMKERKEFGLQKYGTVLQAWNGRNPVVDGYQEVQDQAVYMKQAVIEFTAMQKRITGLEVLMLDIMEAATRGPGDRINTVIKLVKAAQQKRLPPWQAVVEKWPRQ